MFLLGIYSRNKTSNNKPAANATSMPKMSNRYS